MSFGLQLGAALVGDLDREVENGRQRVVYAARRAMDDSGRDFQGKWRQDFIQSGLRGGDRLQKTIKLKVYPNSGLDPAAVIYTTLPKLVQAFESGAVITVAGGKKGALYPNSAVWGGRLARPSGRGARSVTTFAVGKRRFGALQFIPTPGKGKLIGVFVAKLDRVARADGRNRKAGVRALKRREFDRVVVFWVLHEPRLPILLRGAVIRRRASAEFPRTFERSFERHLAQAEAGLAQLTFQGDL